MHAETQLTCLSSSGCMQSALPFQDSCDTCMRGIHGQRSWLVVISAPAYVRRYGACMIDAWRIYCIRIYTIACYHLPIRCKIPRSITSALASWQIPAEKTPVLCMQCKHPNGRSRGDTGKFGAPEYYWERFISSASRRNKRPTNTFVMILTDPVM